MKQKHGKSKLTYEFPNFQGAVRLRELILYISSKCADDPAFSRTKLIKILFFSDFYSYKWYGEPITGVTYVKLPFGPGPKILPHIQDTMVEGGDLVLVKRRHYNREQIRPIARREAKIDIFKPRDIAFVDEVIKDLWEGSATQASEESHVMAWKVASQIKDPIPYDAIFLSEEPITPYERERAQELTNKYGWDVRYNWTPQTTSGRTGVHRPAN